MGDAGNQIQTMLQGHQNFEDIQVQIAHEIGAGVHNLLFHGEVNAPGVIAIMFVIGILGVIVWAFKYR